MAELEVQKDEWLELLDDIDPCEHCGVDLQDPDGYLLDGLLLCGDCADLHERVEADRSEAPARGFLALLRRLFARGEGDGS